MIKNEGEYSLAEAVEVFQGKIERSRIAIIEKLSLEEREELLRAHVKYWRPTKAEAEELAELAELAA